MALSDEQAKSFGAVLVNYNAGALLTSAVKTIRAEGITQIVVVDNGSSDDSLEVMSTAFPDVVAKNLDNPGFGTANNVGVASLDTEYVALLNPDTEVHPGTFAAALQVLSDNPKVAIVGARLLNPNGTTYPSAREFPSLSEAVGHASFSLFWPNNPWSRRYKRLDCDYDISQEVDWVSGAAMFVRRSAFDAVNGFDDRYFMYFEDTDLCWRIRQAGWSIAYEPAAVVSHVQGVSTKGVAYRMLTAHHRSAVRYNFTTARGLQRALLPLFVVGLGIRLPLAWLNEWNKRRK